MDQILEACDRCGSADALRVILIPEENRFAVECGPCRAEGGLAESEEAAIAAWDRGIRVWRENERWFEQRLREQGMEKEFKILEALDPSNWLDPGDTAPTDREVIVMIERADGIIDFDLGLLSSDFRRISGRLLPAGDRVSLWQPFQPAQLSRRQA